MENKAGIGSFFHSTDADAITNFNTQDYITNYSLFYTGRHAIKYIFDKLIAEENIAKIWLPKYYCQHVTSWLQKCYSTIHFYTIDPFNPEHQLNVLDFATDKDIVLLNNFWGLFHYNIPTTANKPFCIEDHSHGWLSSGCLTSKADYCVASLRKTLPIPLGGILWQPNGKTQNNNTSIGNVDPVFYDNWDLVNKAMQLKQNYIYNNSVNDDTLKQKYLNLISDSENYLQHQYQVISVKEEHRKLIGLYLNKNYTHYKKHNLEYLIQNLNKNDNYLILKNNKNTTFGLHLVFKDLDTLQSVKKHLIQKGIYPSELWPGNEQTNSWSFLLNIHIDFRYTIKDMAYIAASLNQWGNY